MPVLATITVVTLLFDGSSDAAPSFLNPKTLKTALQNAIPPQDSHLRAETQKIVAELEVAVDRFQSAINAAMDNAVLASNNKVESADSTDAIFSDLDRQRYLAIQDILSLRDQLISILDQKTWSRVFLGIS